jgi:hypothetical protein
MGTAQNTDRTVITTDDNHNLTNGSAYTISGVTGTGSIGSINSGTPYTVHVINVTQFSVAYNGTTGSYTSGGTVTPNPIVKNVSLYDTPDTYVIPYVQPAVERVTIQVTWDTDSPNYISPEAIHQAAEPALRDYINSLPVGTAPINIYDMQSIFLAAVGGIIQAEAVTTLTFAVSFSGSSQTPNTGTGVIYGDPNSYFESASGDITFYP